MVFVGVAAVAALAAMGVRFANQPAAIEGFSDVGQEFFADFKDPLKAMELSVAKYDSETREPLSFSVKQNEKMCIRDRGTTLQRTALQPVSTWGTCRRTVPSMWR